MEEDETASERPVVLTGGSDVVGSPEAAIAKLVDQETKNRQRHTCRACDDAARLGIYVLGVGVGVAILVGARFDTGSRYTLDRTAGLSVLDDARGLGVLDNTRGLGILDDTRGLSVLGDARGVDSSIAQVDVTGSCGHDGGRGLYGVGRLRAGRWLTRSNSPCDGNGPDALWPIES